MILSISFQIEEEKTAISCLKNKNRKSIDIFVSLHCLVIWVFEINSSTKIVTMDQFSDRNKCIYASRWLVSASDKVNNILLLAWLVYCPKKNNSFLGLMLMFVIYNS